MKRNENTSSIKVVLYKQKTYKNGEHPLMIQIIQNRKIKRISINGLTCSPKHWDFDKNELKKSHPNYLELKLKISTSLNDFNAKQIELLNDKIEATPTTIINAMKSNTINKSVFEFFEIIIERLIVSKKIGNSHVYKDTFNSIKSFRNNEDFMFSEMNFSFLANFETHLRSKGLKDTTLSVRFRTLRALFNSAINENIVSKDKNPFNEFKISGKRFNNETKRIALHKNELLKIVNLDTENDYFLTLAKDLFLFSYYGAGINFTDICRLSNENIHNNRIYYKRSKTRSEVNFILLNPALEIIEKWKPYTINSDYLFPILTKKHITEIQIDNRINKMNTIINKNLKKIAELCGIKSNLTTQVARHTFATTLKREGVNTAVIQEAMKHKTQLITNTYLASFEDDIKDKAMEKLL